MSKAHNSQISRRYAEALYNAVPHSEQSNVLDEFKKVIIILGDAKIKDVFYHPRTSRKRKNELIDLMGLSKILSDFLKLIVEKSRERFLLGIENHFEQKVLYAQQTTKAEVISAISLTTDTIDELKGKLEKITDKKVIINNVINPKIGGGMIISVDGKVIDGSVLNSLKQFQRCLIS